MKIGIRIPSLTKRIAARTSLALVGVLTALAVSAAIK